MTTFICSDYSREEKDFERERERERDCIQTKMVLLENDQFLSEMTKMYERNREKGSVWTTMKSSLCLNRPTRRRRKRTTTTEKDDFDDDEGKNNTGGGTRCCLVRCTDGKRKISTRVYATKAEKFAAAFTLVQKASMDGLKEKEKKKKTKKKKTTTTTEEKKDAMDASAPEKKKKTKKKKKKSGGGGGGDAK